MADLQYAKFSAYGFLKNLRFFEPFLILYLLDVGVSYLEIGTLYAVREITVNVLEIPTGFIADALGRRRTMIASFIGYIGAYVLFAVAPGFWVLLSAMVLFAAGDALRTGTHKAMIMAHLRATGRSAEKSRYYGRTRSWSQIGSAVSALGGAAIVFVSLDYRAAFIYSIVPYVLDLLLILTYPAELDGPRRSLSVGDIRSSFAETFRSVAKAARKARMPRLLANASLLGGFHAAAKDFLQPVLVAVALSLPLFVDFADEQRSAVVVGITYTLLYVATSVASRKAADVAGSFGGPRQGVNSTLLLGVISVLGAGFFSLIDVPWASVLLFAALYILHNLRRPVAVTLISDCVSDDIQATALSVESLLKTGISAGLAFLIGLAANLADGQVGVGLLVIGVIGLVALPLVWIRRRDATILGCEI